MLPTPSRGTAPRPRFAKYHALGNDYIVLDPGTAPPLDAATVRRLCDRHRGLGGDGILLGPSRLSNGILGLRIFNPDGSEAELSGNGLRILARAARDLGLVSTAPFLIRTAAGDTTATVASDGRLVELALAPASFLASRIPVVGAEREVLDEHLDLDGETLAFSAVTVGNPHCVLIRPEISAEEARRLGPRLETHPLFPRRTNVQLAAVRDRQTLSLEIWERGAGYTLASGSSSLAAAAVAHRLGLVDRRVRVEMPGGSTEVEVGPAGLRLRGEVTAVATGELDQELWD